MAAKWFLHIIKVWLPAMLCLLAAQGCHDVAPCDDTVEGNFEQLWRAVDEHYCFFAFKDVDWDEVHARYAAKLRSGMSQQELFEVCAAMLDELRDGHVNLAAPFATSYYREWWSLYPQNFSDRLVEQHYFNFNYRSLGPVTYGLLPSNVAYVRYSTFASSLGEGNLDEVLAYCATATGMVIDVRDNGGGDMTAVETLVARFIQSPTLVGYISHKTGPGRDAFSEPRPITYNPAAEGRMRWTKPVAVLTNRSTFSAANNFVSIMRLLPQVTVVGDVTGGGCGMPFSSELTNGWSLRLSACPVYDDEGRLTEFGIEPHIHVDLDPEEALRGRDTMLDRAVQAVIDACE